jgi:signal transduction histidine kinase
LTSIEKGCAKISLSRNLGTTFFNSILLPYCACIIYVCYFYGKIKNIYFEVKYMFSREREIHTPSTNSVQILAAGIAHEVRNPLTAVKGFLKLLK